VALVLDEPFSGLDPGALGDQVPVTDDGHRVAPALDKLEPVAGEHDGNPGGSGLGGHLTEEVDQPRLLVADAHLGVEAALLGM